MKISTISNSLIGWARPFFLLLLLSMVVVSCKEEAEFTVPEEAVISEEVKEQFRQLGFDVSDIQLTDVDDEEMAEFGEKAYLLEGDIMITKQNFKDMLESEIHHIGPNGEQYRHKNLVDAPRTIRVLGYTKGNKALTARMRTGLQRAIDNYNALNLRLRFTLAFGENKSGYDIVVRKRNKKGGGGVAGFPNSKGDPHKTIKINSGTDANSLDAIEHVMTHEIGHCLGLRHSDWYNRSRSCGSGGSESSAIRISGTPIFDSGSIMAACYSTSTDGEFSDADKDALRILY